MSTSKKSKQKSKVGAKARDQQPPKGIMGFAVVSITFLLATDAYYVWKLVQS